VHGGVRPLQQLRTIAHELSDAVLACKSILTVVTHQQVFLKPGQLRPSHAAHRISLKHVVSGVTIGSELHGRTVLSKDKY
jgi:hypothetical protein